MLEQYRNQATRTLLLVLLFSLCSLPALADESSPLCRSVSEVVCPFEVTGSIERNSILWKQQTFEVALCRSAFCREEAPDTANARIVVRVDGEEICDQPLDRQRRATCTHDFGVSLRSRKISIVVSNENVLAQRTLMTLDASPEQYRFRLDREQRARLDEEARKLADDRGKPERLLRRIVLALDADGNALDDLQAGDLQLLVGGDPMPGAVISVARLAHDAPRRVALMVDVSGFIAHGTQSAHWRKSYEAFARKIADEIEIFAKRNDRPSVEIVVTRFAALADGKLFPLDSDTGGAAGDIAEQVRDFLSSPLPEHWVKAQIRHAQLETVGATHFADLQLAQHYTREVWLEDQAASAAVVLGPGRNNAVSTDGGLLIPIARIRERNPLWSAREFADAIEDIALERMETPDSIYRRAAFSSMPFHALLTYESSFSAHPKKSLTYRLFFESQGGFIARLSDHFDAPKDPSKGDPVLSIAQALDRALDELDRSYEVVYRAPKPGSSLLLHTPELTAKDERITLRTQAFGPPNTRSTPAKPRREILALDKSRRFLAAYLARYGGDSTTRLAELGRLRAEETDPQVREILEESYCVLNIRRLSGAWSKRLRKESFVFLFDSPHGSQLCRRYRPLVERIVTDQPNLLGEGTTRRLLRKYDAAR